MPECEPGTVPLSADRGPRAQPPPESPRCRPRPTRDDSPDAGEPAGPRGGRRALGSRGKSEARWPNIGSGPPPPWRCWIPMNPMWSEVGDERRQGPPRRGSTLDTELGRVLDPVMSRLLPALSQAIGNSDLYPSTREAAAATLAEALVRRNDIAGFAGRSHGCPAGRLPHPDPGDSIGTGGSTRRWRPWRRPSPAHRAARPAGGGKSHAGTGSECGRRTHDPGEARLRLAPIAAP